MPTQTAAQKRAAEKAAKAASEQGYDEWDALVAESQIDAKPYRLRVPVLNPKEGEDTHEFITIPIPSGEAYVNLTASQARGDVAGILVNLTTSLEGDEAGLLFDKLMRLMRKADFPIVDKLAARVLAHYFNPAPKAADGSEGGAGE